LHAEPPAQALEHSKQNTKLKRAGAERQKLKTKKPGDYESPGIAKWATLGLNDLRRDKEEQLRR
jgi:hypothetical protein